MTHTLPELRPGAAAPDAGAAIAASLATGELRYSAVWEDHRLLERALGDTGRGEAVVIASAGDNALNLLLTGVPRLTAIDFNPAQVAVTALKLVAPRALTHPEYLRLLGLRDGDDRISLYERVRPMLSLSVRGWLDANAGLIERGLDGAGRLDRFIATFRGAHLAPTAVDTLFTLDRAARARWFDEVLFTPAVAAAFREHFSLEALGAHGRHPDQQRYVADVDGGATFLARLRHACTAIPLRGNFYVERFLRGRLRDVEQGPPYLRAANFGRLRAFGPRMSVAEGRLDEWLDARPARTVATAALSDIFEYLSPDGSDALFDRLARAMAPGGRVAYWNLLVHRTSPAALRPRLAHLDRLSRVLSRRDRAWFYAAFHVEEALA